jgi:hypothetical protein
MKNHWLVLLAALPIAAVAFETPLPLPDLRIESPSLSLVGDALRRAPDFVSDFQRQNRGFVPAMRQVSKMPMVMPAREADPKMVRAPDPSIDYKLIVKVPEVEPAK